jgi:uncharacterized protein YdeI (YjbR/CyaY-like superfamily)
MKNKDVDKLLEESTQWRAEFELLRDVILECELDEVIKWGQPCYTNNGRNIVLIHGFKEYCAILFFKGVLLKDEFGILIQQSENVQAGRQLRFKNVEDIKHIKNEIIAYVNEAIEIEKAGKEVEFKETKAFKMPIELEQKLDHDSNFKTAFESLTPGRQRAYILYFGSPKYPSTREARIEKMTQSILDGKGLND